MSYQNQMNHRHPQKRKIILPKSVDLVKKSSTPQAAQSPHTSLFSSAAGKSTTKTEAWRQAIQRLNNETNKAALTSHLGSRFADRRISEPSFMINRSSVDHQTKVRPQLDTNSFLNRLSVDHGTKSPSTVVLMTHNNNTMKSFEKRTREESSHLEVKMVTGQSFLSKPASVERPKEGGIIVNQN